MIIEVFRIRFSAISTQGLMSVDGISRFTTLEPPKISGMLIPEGDYHCKKSMSPRMKYISPEILDVPGHTGERIHIGNDANDTHGCILVGMSRSPDWIGSSHDAFTELMGITPDEFELSIIEQPYEETA